MLLQQEDMRVSLSRTANGDENGVRESFFQSFKGECIDCESFQTRAQARSVTFEFIECFYTRTRRHSTFHDMSPLQYEQLMC
jgi:putative transposase